MIFGPANVFSLDMERIPISEFGSSLVGVKDKMRLKRLINDPAGTVSLEDFLPGTEVNWAFWHNEVHLIISGKAEITYTLPPSHSKIYQRIAEKGDTYLILNGSRLKFKVLSDEAYRHFCIIMPRYHYEKWLIEEAVKV